MSERARSAKSRTMRPELVEGRDPGASTSSARSTSGNGQLRTQGAGAPEIRPACGRRRRPDVGTGAASREIAELLPVTEAAARALGARADDLEPESCCWPSSESS